MRKNEMACRKAKMRAMVRLAQKTETTQLENTIASAKVIPEKNEPVTTDVIGEERLLFGADFKVQADDVLQNNLSLFEWVVRNKVYPAFVGRNIVGENCLTRTEIEFLHDKGCKIAAIYNVDGEKETKEQGGLAAKAAEAAAHTLGIPVGMAVFVEAENNEVITRDFMLGFAESLVESGYVPGFKANTDAAVDFDHQFSMGMQTHKDVFDKCLLWAEAPNLKEYDRVTTTHLIHPDNWRPYAPSGITRNDIAVWQYGKECHPIQDDNGKETFFNVNLVRNEKVIIEKMY